jgi:hypothetical protein
MTASVLMGMVTLTSANDGFPESVLGPHDDLDGDDAREILSLNSDYLIGARSKREHAHHGGLGILEACLTSRRHHVHSAGGRKEYRPDFAVRHASRCPIASLVTR